MYIKYVNEQEVLKIEKLDLTIEQLDCKDEQGNKIDVFELSNCNLGRKINEILVNLIEETLCLLRDNAVPDINLSDIDHFENTESRITFGCHRLGLRTSLSVTQFKNFMNLLSEALENDIKLFDITAITEEDLGQD